MPTSDRLNISSRSLASASSSLCCDFSREASASTTTMPTAPGVVSCVRRSASEHQIGALRCAPAGSSSSVSSVPLPRTASIRCATVSGGRPALASTRSNGSPGTQATVSLMRDSKRRLQRTSWPPRR